MKRAAFLTIVLVISLSALAAALLIQYRRAIDLERRLQATTAYLSRIERERQTEIVRRQADQGLILGAPTAAQQPSRSMDSSCRLTSAWLKAEISAADVAPDGSRVAAIVDDEVRVWEAATGRLAQQIRFDDESPVSLRFAPDCCTLAIGEAARHERRWGIRIIHCADEGRPAEIRGERFQGRRLAFSLDGRTLASSQLGGATLWDTTSGRTELAIEHRRSDIQSMALSPRGDRVAFGDGSGNLMLWDLSTGKEIRTIQGHRRQIVSIDFSPDGSSVASGSLDHVVRVWSATTGREQASLHEESALGCIDRVLAVRFSPTGETLISVHTDLSVRYWETAAYRLTGKSMLVPSGERSEFVLLSATLAQDGRSLVGIVARDGGALVREGEGKRIAIWDVLRLRSTRS